MGIISNQQTIRELSTIESIKDFRLFSVHCTRNWKMYTYILLVLSATRKWGQSNVPPNVKWTSVYHLRIGVRTPNGEKMSPKSD